jgi:predicted polyphosphate/ATP-dependent NAD kinase
VQPVRKVGLIVNPIAGMGGKVGLKGTDGKEALRKAKELGAEPVAPPRASEFIAALGTLAKTMEFVTCPGSMGEDVLRDCGVIPKVIPGKRRAATTANDTKAAAAAMAGMGLDLIIFCGGDGTARDIMDAIGEGVPVLGIPAGVKMQSGVFATTVKEAANVAMRHLWGELPLREGEVADVDEEAYRKGRLSTRLYGYLLVPYEPHSIQGMKAPSAITDDVMENRSAIAKYVAERMERGVGYILGPGSTVKAINERLGEPMTLLGVDLMKDGRVVVNDANESEILKELGSGRWQIVVSPIGRQGFLFGRGNQQVSPRVIKAVGKDGILVVATRDKMEGIDRLIMDTGDSEADGIFQGVAKVLVDYGVFVAVPVE